VLALFEGDRLDATQLQAVHAQMAQRHEAIRDAVTQAIVEIHDTLTRRSGRSSRLRADARAARHALIRGPCYRRRMPTATAALLIDDDARLGTLVTEYLGSTRSTSPSPPMGSAA